MFEERTYRDLVKTDDLVKFEVIVKETDLLVRAERDLSKEARESVLRYRHQLETYIAMNPEFQTSLIPVKDDPHVPEIIQEMIRTSQLAHVGPMAAVAGAMAEMVSKDLLKLSKEVIVENGGDIYLATSKERTVGIYAGHSPLSLKIGILIKPEEDTSRHLHFLGNRWSLAQFWEGRCGLHPFQIRSPCRCGSDRCWKCHSGEEGYRKGSGKRKRD